VEPRRLEERRSRAWVRRMSLSRSSSCPPRQPCRTPAVRRRSAVPRALRAADLTPLLATGPTGLPPPRTTHPSRMGQFEQQSSSRKIPREPSMDLGMSSSSLGGTSTAFDAPAGAPELSASSCSCHAQSLRHEGQCVCAGMTGSSRRATGGGMGRRPRSRGAPARLQPLQR
jgi:hypothetical protein